MKTEKNYPRCHMHNIIYILLLISLSVYQYISQYNIHKYTVRRNLYIIIILCRTVSSCTTVSSSITIRKEVNEFMNNQSINQSINLYSASSRVLLRGAPEPGL